MELTISIIAVLVSGATFLFTIMVTYRGEQREKKQATLDALNVLQEQVFDNLNTYTFGEIKNISSQWQLSLQEKDKYVSDKQETAEEFWNAHHEYDSAIEEYRKVSGYLARIEHFALGVNTGIYDVKVTERAATAYFAMLYKKLMSILAVKNKSTSSGANYKNEFHTEFETLAQRIQKIKILK